MSSAFKDGRIAIELDKERYLLFSLNALDELQERFGSIEELPKLMQGQARFKNVRTLLTILLNEGAQDGEVLTEQQVGRLIHTGNFVKVQNAILAAFSKGTDGGEKGDENGEEEGAGEKNGKSGQE